MNVDLKVYQDSAINELVEALQKLIKKNAQHKVCVFQAPTGSGKTLMTAKSIEDLIRELPEEDLCFIWVSIGKGELHLQSKRSLEKIFAGFPQVLLVEEEFVGGRNQIARNEVIVVNWEKLRSKDRQTGDWKNILMKDGEKLNFRDVLAKTREERKIILIIDESHLSAKTKRASELRYEILADVVLEMSATPSFELSAYVCVEPKDVIEEGVIKKELIINEGMDKISSDEMDSQEAVLEAAYQKRQMLKKLFEKEHSPINPLVLIQIPTAEVGGEKINAIRQFLTKKDITEYKNGQGNGKLAIWLSEEKSETLDSIAQPDNQIEFLIFKQAIGTGWDCPRAHILVKFRESHSETFEVQTMGRILRMPELKHYDNEALNRGYIFTNVQSIIVKKEEYNPNMIKHLNATLKDCYQPIRLDSYYRSRADYGDVTSSFDAVFEKVACKRLGIDKTALFDQNLKMLEAKGMVIDVEKLSEDTISDGIITSDIFDDFEGEVHSNKRVFFNVAANDQQTMFEKMIGDNLGSFTSIKRSLPKVKTAIYIWFEKYLGTKSWPEPMDSIQKICLHPKNRTQFESILVEAIDQFTFVRNEEVQARIEASEKRYLFDIPERAYYNEHIEEQVELEKYVYNPCFLKKDRSRPELAFEELLSKKSNRILWWWKNGEGSKDYLGIKYTDPTDIHTFYPDYLMRFHDGRIGIFEIKHERDPDGNSKTKAKAEALQAYIKEQNRKGKNLVGGIVIQRNNRWQINQEPIYDWKQNNWSDWQDLNI